MKSLWSKIRILSLLIIPIIVFITGCVTTPSSTKPASSLSTELVKLETRHGIELKILLIKPVNPVAIIVLFEGGPGKLTFKTVSGKPTIKEGPGFLVRTRDDFVKKGFMIALVDAPSDKKRMSPIFRISNEYAQDLKVVVSYLNKKTNLPLWLVGMSLGSFSATNGAANIREGVDGLVLVSSPTISDENWLLYNSHPKGILSMGLDNIQVPTLTVVHKEDECPDTPASNAQKIKASLINSPRSEVAYFSGGGKPKTNPRSPTPPGCQPLTQHGYYGIENEVISAIAEFIKSNSR